MTFAVLASALFGLLVGSFLNVVIYRVPQGRSVVRPGSTCPSCGHEISARDNIPVLSWLLLRGRCRACGAAISARYPIVEAVTGVLWGLLTWWAMASDVTGLLPLLLTVSAAGVALFVIDLDELRLPDAIVLPLYPLTAVGLVLSCWVDGRADVAGLVIGLAAWLVPIGAIWLFTRGRGMGLGDVKLAPVLGAVLGWVGAGSAVVGLVAAFGLGAVVGVGLLVTRRAGRRSQVPFGPFMLAGAGVGLFFGDPITSWYSTALLG